MSETPKLLLEKDGPIGWIIFNQPEKRNAVSREMWELMPKYVEDLSTDNAIRVVILRGAGEQAFVSGADISQFKDRRKNMADEEQYRRISARGQDSLNTLTKPLLAMIHGFCIGGGLSIAISCDMRICSDDSRFGVPAARLGLGYHYTGMEKRVWWLAAGIFVPLLVGLVASGERPLAVAPLFALAEVPLAALAFWALGAWIPLDNWMRRLCFRAGLAGLVMYFLARRFELLPRWLTEWPAAGGALSLTTAEAAYLESSPAQPYSWASSFSGA